MASSLYQQLPQGRFTRLLKNTSSGTPDSRTLRLELHVVDLENSCPEYAALSYTWGAPFSGPGSEAYEGEAGIVEVDVRADDGPYQKVKLDRNLVEGLHRIHKACWNSWLWVDAICINQQDNEEKVSQVNRMSVVYSNAAVVICWLGEPDEYTERFNDFYDGFAADCERVIDQTGRLPSIRVSMPGPSERGGVFCDETLKEITIEMLQTVVCFYRRRYFGRIWIVQEFCLASRLWLLFGSRVFAFERLHKVIDWFMKNLSFFNPLWQDGFAGLSLGSGTIGALVGPAFMFFTYLPNIARTHHQGGPGHKGFKELAREQRGSRSARTDLFVYLEELIWQTRCFEATAGHDNICGLLGLVNAYVEPDVAFPIMPNYTTPVPEFYQEVATILLRETPDLTTLGLLRPDNRDKFPSLPSWCPNFESDPRVRAMYGVQSGDIGVFVRYNAYPTKSEETTTIVINGRHLNLSAVYVDTVTASAGPDWIPHPVYGPFPGTLRVCLFILKAINDFGPSYWNGEPIEAAVLMAATYTSHKCGRETPSDLLGALKKWLAFCVAYCELLIHKDVARDGESAFPELQLVSKQFVEMSRRLGGDRGLPTILEVGGAKWVLENVLSELEALSEKVGTAFENACFEALGSINALIRTNKGFLGVTARSVDGGDEVWIPCRGKVPLVLRPVKDKTGFYTVVGEAYIHGIMRGELAQQNMLPEPRKLCLI